MNAAPPGSAGSATAPAPRRTLGPWMAAALVVGNMVGSGVFLLPASLGRFGGICLLGWLFTTAGALTLALTFARLARAQPVVGGPYAYTRSAFGRFPAFLVAWGYWVSICSGNAAIAVALAGYLGFFVPGLASDPRLGAAAAIAAVWLLTAVNARGVREAGGVQLATTLLKLAPLVAIGTLGLLSLHVEHFVPFNASGASTLSAVSSTAALTLWAFLGLESATIPAADVERPDRSIPRATVAGTVAAAAVYVASTVGVMGVLPPAALAASSAPFADAASRMWGPWAASLVAAGAVISCFGALNGWTLLSGQMPRAAAEDGLLPGAFARLNARGAPAAALVLSSALVTLVVGLNYTRGLVAGFTFIILLSTIAALVAYLFSTAAAVRAWLRDAARPRRVVPLALAALALAYTAWAVVGAGRDAVLWGGVLLAAGVPVYAWGLRRGTRRAG